MMSSGCRREDGLVGSEVVGKDQASRFSRPVAEAGEIPIAGFRVMERQIARSDRGPLSSASLPETRGGLSVVSFRPTREVKNGADRSDS
jgi:hypothetical protein